MTAETLRREARRAAEWRGHTLARFTRNGPTSWTADCRTCAAEVTVDTHPAPNGIDIGGPAVAVGCEPVPCRFDGGWCVAHPAAYHDR